MRVNLDDRFWSKVEKTESCWVWTAYKLAGYGRYRISPHTYYAHRLAFAEQYGAIPSGMVVDHICWNPACVNPAHLQLVDRSGNGQNRTGLDSNNKTGARGVSWHKQTGKYRAYANRDGKQIYLGLHAELEDAARAAHEWRRENMPNSLIDQSPASERGFSLPM